MQIVTFEQAASPVCSIIVLAWRLTDELIDSLAAVSASAGAPEYEVVLVLNGAGDDVRATVAEFVRGAVLVDLPENVGFGGGCNAGASVARGAELVFLNDDTLVDSAWLAELHRAAAADPSIGGVASLLLNADGTLQESGSRVLPDGGTAQFGNGLSLDEARAAGLLDPRGIDYGSAAALLVRTDAFRQLSGFDPAYEPAYFEDADLQLRLKSAGYMVVIEPTAVVTHLSGRSSAKSHLFQEWAASHSLAIFRDRWAGVLGVGPDADAPLGELRAVPVDPDLVNGGRPLLTADDIAAAAGSTAATIARGFAASLVERYDFAVLQRREFEEKLAAAAAELAALSETAEQLRGENKLFTERLADLEARGPLGIVKWRAGVAASQRRQKKA